MKKPHQAAITTAAIAFVPGCLALYLVVQFVQSERERADRRTCTDTLRGVGQAMAMYVADYDGFFPGERQWYKNSIAALPRTGCPAAETVPALDPPLRDIGHGLPGYAFNRYLSGKMRVIDGRLIELPLRYTTIPFPATTIAVFDYTNGIATTISLDLYRGSGNIWPKQLAQGWKRHGGKGNYLFCDGHVASFAEKDIFIPETDDCAGNGKSPMFCK